MKINELDRRNDESHNLCLLYTYLILLCSGTLIGFVNLDSGKGGYISYIRAPSSTFAVRREKGNTLSTDTA
jgi:hypothetical protein